MEHMNLLDITIRYFNVIVFVLCVLFGMISLFASWIAWREIHRKQNIIRSIVAAYNIAEETLEKSRTARGDFEFDPAIVQTVFNSMQEILNAVYGEVTGKPIPPSEERTHRTRKRLSLKGFGRMRQSEEAAERINIDHGVPSLMPDDKSRQCGISPP